MTAQNSNSLLQFIQESIRLRASWNERFQHWERAESTTETVRIERARDMVQSALGESTWLALQGAKLVQQGSFTNRTNTRGESDIDLRVQHPWLKIECAGGVDLNSAWLLGGYSTTGVSLANVAQEMRREIVTRLVGAFGRAAVDDTGRKAVTVRGLEGSRSEVDVVPCFTLHYVTSTGALGNTWNEGVAILGTDGNWTYNYPDQHIANGRAKRERTSHRFKRVVRTIKRMQADMLESNNLIQRVPSFLIECLVYLVEDQYFLVETDDRYDRVKRVLDRASDHLRGGLATYLLTEINGVKSLFAGGQSWTLPDAQTFVQAALAHLGDA